MIWMFSKIHRIANRRNSPVQLNFHSIRILSNWNSPSFAFFPLLAFSPISIIYCTFNISQKNKKGSAQYSSAEERAHGQIVQEIDFSDLRVGLLNWEEVSSGRCKGTFLRGCMVASLLTSMKIWTIGSFDLRAKVILRPASWLTTDHLHGLLLSLIAPPQCSFMRDPNHFITFWMTTPWNDVLNEFLF